MYLLYLHWALFYFRDTRQNRDASHTVGAYVPSKVVAEFPSHPECVVVNLELAEPGRYE